MTLKATLYQFKIILLINMKWKCEIYKTPFCVQKNERQDDEKREAARTVSGAGGRSPLVRNIVEG